MKSVSLKDLAETLPAEGQMNLEIDGELVAVGPGEIFIVPAGKSHAVAAGSRGILMIVDPVGAAE